MPARLRVSGGRCASWPKGPLKESGATIQCERSGNGSVTVVLETSDGRTLRELLPALRVAKLPDEPMQENRRNQRMEVVTLHRTRDYHQVELGRGCPTCRLYAADFSPSAPDATILSVAVVRNSGGPDWSRCPASGYRCGVPEFSPREDRRTSGCAGAGACRIWRLSEDGEQGWDVVQMIYEARESVCSNCLKGMSYEDAHKQWEAAVAEANARACREFADPPPQNLPAAGGRSAR
jgi:hypothetical protein